MKPTDVYVVENIICDNFAAPFSSTLSASPLSCHLLVCAVLLCTRIMQLAIQSRMEAFVNQTE